MPTSVGGQQYLGDPPWTDRDSMTHYYLDEEYSIEQIVTDVCDRRITESELRERLSSMDLLDPWDDPKWLRDQYRDRSAPEIAEDLPVTGETIRNRLHAFDLMDATSRDTATNTTAGREMLEEMDIDEFDALLEESDR